MWKDLKVTAIIPCLNEEQGIDEVLRRMPEYIDEVIVVDSSTDRTRRKWRLRTVRMWCRRWCAVTAGPIRKGSRTPRAT
ncbi:MAG: hypothetical protein R2748_15415 [Bryobacterales bacterium]